MKRFMLIAMMFASFESLYGQGFQVGVRTGIQYLAFINYYQSNGNKTYTSTKGIYLRKTIKSGWAIEANANHCRYYDSHLPVLWGCAGWGDPPNIGGKPYTDLSIANTYNQFSINLAVQYNMICNNIKQKYTVLSKFDYYMGISMGATRTYDAEKTFYNFPEDNTTSLYYKTGYRHTGIEPNIGIMNTLGYRINKRLIINISAIATGEPWNMLSNNGLTELSLQQQANLRMSCTIGLSYKL